MSVQQQRPDTLLTTLHVPFVTDDYDYQVHTIIGKIDDQGILTIGGDYTPEQKAAMVAYFTHNNEHLHERRGNSLTVMSEEQQALYDAAIEAMKSTYQKLRERVERLLLNHYREENWVARMCYYEEHENYTYYLEEYVKDGELVPDAPANMWCYHEWRQSGKLPEGFRLFECTVREGYGEWYLERRYRDPLRSTSYWVTLSPGGDLAIIHSIRDERSWKRAEEET